MFSFDVDPEHVAHVGCKPCTGIFDSGYMSACGLPAVPLAGTGLAGRTCQLLDNHTPGTQPTLSAHSLFWWQSRPRMLDANPALDSLLVGSV